MGIPHQFYHKTLKTLGFLRRSLKISNRKRKLRTKPLFTHFLSMQPLYGIPTLQVRPRPFRRSNAEQQDGSPTDTARHHALTPCLMPSTGQHSKNDAGELDWRCSTSSTTVLIVSINCSYLPKPPGRGLSSRKNSTCSYDIPSRRTQYRRMSFFPRTIPDWNGLPREFVTAQSCLLYTSPSPRDFG